ncbi:hypothetical protein AB2T96_11285 [Clostridium butyricum]|uniref:hypothetical protein n=1 Tax=Clostridium butyricum TaxID=1492 RepID=UPI0034667E04
MIKNLKVLVSTLLIGASFLGSVPVSAAIIPVDKPTSTITPAFVSQHQPYEGYTGNLWCTGDSVRKYGQSISGNVSDAGYMEYGEKIHCTNVSNGFVYFNDGVSYYHASAKYFTYREKDV